MDNITTITLKDSNSKKKEGYNYLVKINDSFGIYCKTIEEVNNILFRRMQDGMQTRI